MSTFVRVIHQRYTTIRQASKTCALRLEAVPTINLVQINSVDFLASTIMPQYRADNLFLSLLNGLNRSVGFPLVTLLHTTEGKHLCTVRPNIDDPRQQFFEAQARFGVSC